MSLAIASAPFFPCISSYKCSYYTLLPRTETFYGKNYDLKINLNFSLPLKKTQMPCIWDVLMYNNVTLLS